MSKLTFGRSSNSVSIQRTSCLHRGGNSHNNIIAKLYEYRSAPTDGESFFFLHSLGGTNGTLFCSNKSSSRI